MTADRHQARKLPYYTGDMLRPSSACPCAPAYLAHSSERACECRYIITKTRLYNFDPIKPHFYIVKLGFTGYTLFFLYLLKNIDCGYSLEPPRRGGSNEYPQSMF